MAEKPSDKSPWESRFGGGYVSDAQYLAESMCDRMARTNDESLPMKFWDTVKWKKKFLMQLREANSLLKRFSYVAIVKALRTNSGKKVYSLGAKWLLDIIKNEQEKVDADNKKVEEAIAVMKVEQPAPTPTIKQKPRPSFVSKKKQNLMQRLDNLNGQKSDEGE